MSIIARTPSFQQLITAPAAAAAADDDDGDDVADSLPGVMLTRPND